MNYTTLAKVKSSMDSVEVVQDPVLEDYISRASRMVDLFVTGIAGAQDYFTQASVVDEVLTNGRADYTGRLSVYPHKYPVTAITSLSYRYSLRDTWRDANISYVGIEGEAVVYDGCVLPSERIIAKLSYTGGFSNDAATLPADLIELATLLSVRLFKEARSGLGDSIGVPELGTLVYTKALPTRAVEIIRHYERIAPWT